MSITVNCSPDDPEVQVVKVHNTTCYVKEIHVGKVLYKREYNGYDDSDFYAGYWDEETQSVKEYEYATTRFWCYHLGAVVDATPEVLDKAAAWQAAKDRRTSLERRWKRRCELKAMAAMHKLPSYRTLLKLTAWPETLQLLSKKRRGKFALSIQAQILAWLANPAPEYDSPLSGKQLSAIRFIDEPRRRY